MNCGGIQFGLACFIMVALTGLAGFIIVYHYATYERPLQQFAIVTDAGSTQTRSSLFTVSLNSANLNEWISTAASNEADAEKNSSLTGQMIGRQMPLAKLFQVRQVSTCLNGGPLAALQSQSSATNLTMKCLGKFSRLIKRLDFKTINNNNDDEIDDDDESKQLDSEEVSEQLARANHRVNSVTHFYLGATAGMRALSKLNLTRAREKIHWMDEALNESSQLLADGPFINKGFLDIIDGSDEAAFGWASVNFVCDRLEAKHRRTTTLAESLSESSIANKQAPSESLPLHSVGTLELGGASAQMAYQVPDDYTEYQMEATSLNAKHLNLFNNNYKLATRSDLCLGMSQAVLRVNYVLMRQSYGFYNHEQANTTTIELPNACMQNRSSISFSGTQLGAILGAPCLAASELDLGDKVFRDFIATAKEVRLVGLGNVTECNQLLSNLIEPQSCRRYFSLCPASKNRLAPPAGMPFVTISGYNKALLVLDLNKEPPLEDNQLEQNIADKLGGYSINQQEYVNKSREFCSLDVAQFPVKYPKMNKAYYNINCLQLLYINKLLTEFYLFEPTSSLKSWKQIKFLLFPVAPRQKQDQIINKGGQMAQDGTSDKNDIGWTLGLLLNATSQRLSDDPTGEQFIFYHHGASLTFILRATILLMFACTLLAICFIGTAIVAVQRRRRCGQAYMNRSYEDSI